MIPHNRVLIIQVKLYVNWQRSWASLKPAAKKLYREHQAHLHQWWAQVAQQQLH